MSNKIKKLIIPVTSNDEGLFPLVRAIPKELLALGESPLIQHIVDEVVNFDPEEVVFVLPAEKKVILNHFNELEKVAEKNEQFRRKYAQIKFSTIIQKKGTSGAGILFKAKDSDEEEAFAISFSDTVFFGKKSSIEQLYSVYRTSQKQVAALKEVSEEELSSSYVVKTEKIANRFYKIKKIIKGADAKGMEEPVLAIAGRYIFTPAIFDYLKNSGAKASVIDVLNDMIGAGKAVYGHQCEGVWHNINSKEDYLKAQRFFLDN